MGRVDLHAHILPGIDDGPETMDESLAMARLAAEDGTDTVVAAPHQRDVALASSVQHVRNLQAQLNEALQAEAEPGARPLRVLLGMENHIEPELPDWVDEGIALPVEGTKFILCEPPYTEFPPYADDVLFRLQLKRLVPVILHPERNSELRRKQHRLRALVERGMLVQLTAGSLLGAYGPEVRRAAESLLRRGLVHVVASDMHEPEGPRSPILSAACDRIRDLAGEDQERRLFDETPRMIVQGHDPHVESGPAGSGPWRSFSRLFRRG